MASRFYGPRSPRIPQVRLQGLHRRLRAGASTGRRWVRCARSDNDRGKALKGLPLVHLGLALSLQGDRGRGDKAIAAGFAFRRSVGWLGDYGSPAARPGVDDRADPERGYPKAAYDARVIDLGRDLEARRSAVVLAEYPGADRAGAAGQALLATRPARCRVRSPTVAAPKRSRRRAASPAISITTHCPAGCASCRRAAAVLRQPGRGRRSAQRARARRQRDQDQSRAVHHRRQAVGSASAQGRRVLDRAGVDHRRPAHERRAAHRPAAGRTEIENMNLGDGAQWADG